MINFFYVTTFHGKISILSWVVDMKKYISALILLTLNRPSYNIVVNNISKIDMLLINWQRDFEGNFRTDLCLIFLCSNNNRGT